MKKYIYIETSMNSNNALGIVWAESFNNLREAKAFRKKQIRDTMIATDETELDKSKDDMIHRLGVEYEFGIYPVTDFTMDVLRNFKQWAAL